VFSESPRLRMGLFVLTAFVVLLGVYASWLNREFYAREAPFFDSASYTNYLARVVGTTQADGPAQGLDIALDASTAPLPGIEVFLLALLHVPLGSMRQAGVWLQAIWLEALAIALYCYWTRARGAGPWSALTLTLPFLMFAGVFHYNGGLFDFRLDLSLYLLLGSAVAWYLQTESAPETRLEWLLTGMFLALATLSRATAPVYAVVMLGPILAARLCFDPKRRAVLQGIGWMLLPALLVCLPYFLYHFEYLHFYYVQFSADANAGLALKDSIAHLRFALTSLGIALGIAGGAGFVASFWPLSNPARVDWKLLYLGLAPVLFLVLRGAGPNPFVSMPAVLGWLLFLLAPLKGKLPARPWASALLVLACGWNAWHAPGQSPYPKVHMAAFRQAIDRMRDDSLKRRLPKVDFVTLHNWNFHPQFLRSVLLNDYGYRSSREATFSPEGIPWVREHLYKWKSLEGSYEMPFTAAVPLVWQEQVAGADDAEKIDWLLSEARSKLDYVFIPDEETITFMEKYIAHNFINTKVRAIRKRFLESGEWERLGPPLEVTDVERVEMYKKR
jgi:hypothetical protein